MYGSCHDTIRTHIPNWSQSCRNHIFGTAVRFQPGQIPAVQCPRRVTTRQDKTGSGFWPVLEPNRTEPQIKSRTAGGLPGPIANTHLGLSWFRLFVDIHLSDIDSLYWEKLQRHAPCCILRMRVNRASTIFSFASWVFPVQIGCRHPFVRCSHTLVRKSTARFSLPHHENHR